MGGDQLVPAVAGDDVEQRLGEQLRADWADEFAVMLGEIQPFAGGSTTCAGGASGWCWPGAEN